MAYVLISSSIPVKNNYGSLLHGGNSALTTTFKNRNLSTFIPQTVSHGSINVGSGQVTGIRPATTETGALFNKVVKDHYVGPYITDGTLAGVAKTVHNTPASDYGRRGIHRNIAARQLGVTNWNYLTGAATYNGSRGSTYDMTAASGGGTVDEASAPTLGVPGELVYRNGSTTPVRTTYTTRRQVK